MEWLNGGFLLIFMGFLTQIKAQTNWTVQCSSGLCTYQLLIPATNISVINSVNVKVNWTQSQAHNMSIQVGSLFMRINNDNVTFQNNATMLKSVEKALSSHLSSTNQSLQQANQQLQTLQANISSTNNVVRNFGAGHPCYQSCLNPTVSSTVAPQTCQHNGSLYNMSGPYCACPIGWYGRYCQNIVCLNGSPAANNDTCFCPAGKTGAHCGLNGTSSNPCASNPCANGATCTPQTDANYTCSCRLGYDPATNCQSCLSTGYDPSIGCQSCLPNYDSTTNCSRCVGNYDFLTGCTQYSCWPSAVDVYQGPFNSVNWPKTYPVNEQCTWTVKAPEGFYPYLTFSYFHVEANAYLCSDNQGCCDSVSFYDGPISVSNLIGTFCGPNNPQNPTASVPNVIHSTYSNYLTVVFTSNNAGFRDLPLNSAAEGNLAFAKAACNQQTCGFNATVSYANSTCSDGSKCSNNGTCIPMTNGPINNVGYCVCTQPTTNGTFCNTTLTGCQLNPCNNPLKLNYNNCTDNGGASYQCHCNAPYSGVNCQNVVVKDCYEVYKYISTNPGVYNITTQQGSSPKNISVYCNQGWTTILNRTNDGQSFQKSATAYNSLFGSLTGSHWLGLDSIHALTNQSQYTLKVSLTDCNYNYAFAKYALFSIGSGTDYILNVSSTTTADSTAGDSFNGNDILVEQNGNKFRSCASHNPPLGSWWFSQCFGFEANLNGPYQQGCTNPSANTGIQWNSWKESTYSYYAASMSIYPANPNIYDSAQD